MYKRLPLFLMIALLFAGMTIRCQKAEVEDDPCAGLIGDVSPVSIYVKFVDRETGEDIIVANGLDRDDIEITVGQTEDMYTDWRIYHHKTPNPLNGAIEFIILPPDKADDYPYNIQVGGFGAATFSYTVDEVEDDNPCRSGYTYQITAIEITDHPFEPLEHEGKTYPNILVVAL